VFLSLLFTIPQSSRWLVLKGHVAQAESSLRRLGCAVPLFCPDDGAAIHNLLAVFPGNAGRAIGIH
jgi:hypothetical protein